MVSCLLIVRRRWSSKTGSILTTCYTSFKKWPLLGSNRLPDDPRKASDCVAKNWTRINKRLRTPFQCSVSASICFSRCAPINESFFIQNLSTFWNELYVRHLFRGLRVVMPRDSIRKARGCQKNVSFWKDFAAETKPLVTVSHFSYVVVDIKFSVVFAWQYDFLKLFGTGYYDFCNFCGWKWYRQSTWVI